MPTPPVTTEWVRKKLADFAALPSDITSIDLSWNYLGIKKGDELATAFKALPVNITSIHLIGNELNRLSETNLQQLSNALPHIKTIYLSANEIREMSLNQARALKAIFPGITRFEEIRFTENTRVIDGADAHPLLKRLGIVSPLKMISAFFVKNNPWAPEALRDLPNAVQSYLKISP